MTSVCEWHLTDVTRVHQQKKTENGKNKWKWKSKWKRTKEKI